MALKRTAATSKVQHIQTNSYTYIYLRWMCVYKFVLVAHLTAVCWPQLPATATLHTQRCKHICVSMCAHIYVARCPSLSFELCCPFSWIRLVVAARKSSWVAVEWCIEAEFSCKWSDRLFSSVGRKEGRKAQGSTKLLHWICMYMYV